MFSPASRHIPPGPVITPFHDAMNALSGTSAPAPTSGTWGTASLVSFLPLFTLEPFVVAKAFWCNGATVGTDSIDLGLYRMTNFTTGRLDLIRSTGAVLSAGTTSVVQEVSAWKVAANAAALTTGTDSTDATSYTTASVTLKAGRLYLLSIVNTAASANAVSGITGGATWTSRSTTQYNGTAHRVSIWSGVPTVDYSGALAIDFGANTQTGCRWSLNEFSGVDTATDDGIVQQAVGTGTSTTPLATLAAFASANNATFGVNANTSDSTTTPGTGFTELSDDNTATTPASFLQTQWRVDNDTTSDGTIANNPWGACAVEIKADTSPFVIPPALPGAPELYMAFVVSGTTATILRVAPGSAILRGLARGMLGLSGTFPLPSNCTPVAPAGNMEYPLAGFSRRSLIG